MKFRYGLLRFTYANDKQNLSTHLIGVLLEKTSEHAQLIEQYCGRIEFVNYCERERIRLTPS